MNRLLYIAIGCALGVFGVGSIKGIQLINKTLFAEYVISSPQKIEERISKRLPKHAYDIRHVVEPGFADSAAWLAFSAYPSEANSYVQDYLQKRSKSSKVIETDSLAAKFNQMGEMIGYYSYYSEHLKGYKGELFHLLHDTELNRVYIHEFDM